MLLDHNVKAAFDQNDHNVSDVVTSACGVKYQQVNGMLYRRHTKF